LSLVNATLTTTAADVFTCPDADGSAITAIVLFNSDTVAHTVQLYACPANEAQVVENQLLNISIPAGESFSPDLGKLILANTDTITAKTGEADTTTAVAITISYLNL